MEKILQGRMGKGTRKGMALPGIGRKLSVLHVKQIKWHFFQALKYEKPSVLWVFSSNYGERMTFSSS